MKPIFYALLSSVMFVSCMEADNYNGIDRNATISLRAAAQAGALAVDMLANDVAANDVPTNEQVVIQTTVISFWNKKANDAQPIEIGFSESNRDVKQLRLIISAGNLIDAKGNLLPTFFEGEDCVLVNKRMENNVVKRDTIGYIKNSVMSDAKYSVESAFANGDYQRCYTLFDKAYVFLPTTGAIWRDLKSNNNN